MSNYPPGVSGNEWQIAGPQNEYEYLAERTCGWCGETTVADIYASIMDSYGPKVEQWTCEFRIPEGWDDDGARVCGYENETEDWDWNEG